MSCKGLLLNTRLEQWFQNLHVLRQYNIVLIVLLREHYKLGLFQYILELYTVRGLQNNLRILKQTDEEVQQIDRQIEAEAAAAPPEEEEEAFVPKKGSFMKEDVILKKEMNDIMKNVLSETS